MDPGRIYLLRGSLVARRTIARAEGRQGTAPVTPLRTIQKIEPVTRHFAPENDFVAPASRRRICYWCKKNAGGMPAPQIPDPRTIGQKSGSASIRREESRLKLRDFGEMEIAHLHRRDDHFERLFPGGAHGRA